MWEAKPLIGNLYKKFNIYYRNNNDNPEWVISQNGIDMFVSYEPYSKDFYILPNQVGSWKKSDESENNLIDYVSVKDGTPNQLCQMKYEYEEECDTRLKNQIKDKKILRLTIII